MTGRERRGFVMSNLPSDQKFPTPLSNPDLLALGIPSETLRGLAALQSRAPADIRLPIVELREFRVKVSEARQGIA